MQRVELDGLWLRARPEFVVPNLVLSLIYLADRTWRDSGRKRRSSRKRGSVHISNQQLTILILFLLDNNITESKSLAVPKIGLNHGTSHPYHLQY